MHWTTTAALVLSLTASTHAPQDGDGFAREGERAAKDALEGRPAPALQVTGWMNAGGADGTAPLALHELRGKVVVLDFWGTW